MQAPILYFQNAFYVIGGYSIDDFHSDLITRMNDHGKWSVVGKLNEARDAHNALYDGEFLFVVGGNGEHITEICSFENETATCTVQPPSLTLYREYPELMIVPDLFCKD